MTKEYIFKGIELLEMCKKKYFDEEWVIERKNKLQHCSKLPVHAVCGMNVSETSQNRKYSSLIHI